VIETHRLQAPRQDGAVLAEPSLGEAGALILENRRRLAQLAFPWPDPSFSELRRRARLAALDAGRNYLHHAGEPLPDPGGPSLLMAGHQPELFHPGVWLKNFALHGLAVRHGCTPINLVVDNDTAKTTVLRLPTTDGQPAGRFRMASVPLDRWQGEIPYEERTVQDEEMFAGLDGRVAPLVSDWTFTPCLRVFWADVQQQTHRTPLLGERLAAARRAFERRWACHNLELPVSALCQTEPFAWFAGHLLANLPQFHAIYNDTVHAYRRKYGLRSHNHPVPDLAVEGDWYEAPFWAWRAGQTRRNRLFARLTASAIELRAGNDPWPSLPPSTHHSPLTTHHSPLTTVWRDLETRGFKVRSRALTNTLYARLFLADLFIHGIGGGKYDELTDGIIRRFYGAEPPRFLVLSATLLLPLPRRPARAENCKRLARELRDLHWNPQRHLPDGDGEALDLARQKKAWIALQPADRLQRRQRFQKLRELTGLLEQHVANHEQVVGGQLAESLQQVENNEVLGRRDYPFCLYPEAELREFCTRFL
jgi:hypothetical protein